MKKNIINKITEAFISLIYRRVDIYCDSIMYSFEKVPLKKIINWIKVELSVFFKPARPWGFPTHMQIEPSSLCNLKCVLCPVTEGMKRPVGNMDLGLFKKLIDEVGDYLFLVILWDWGEPFINTEIYEMIAYAKQKGIKLVSSTNGHPFAEYDEADKVVRSGLDSLIFAIDGITQESYVKYRQGGDLDKVFKGINNVIESKRALNSNTPFINFRFIAMRQNEHQIEEVKALALSLGVDALTIKTLNPCSNDTYGTKRMHEYDNWKEFFPENKRYRRFEYDEDLKEFVRVINNPCKNLWNAPAIHWNGVVCPCTFDFEERHALGDLTRQSFKEIWSGEHYIKMRRRFKSDWGKINMCSNCSYAYKGGNCNNEIIAEAVFKKK